MTTKYAIVNAVIYFVLAGVTVGMWWLLLVMATVLLQDEARSDDMIPFSLDGVYMSVPVVMTGPKATISRSCWLDTAATNLWVSFELAEQLGYSMRIARDANYSMPGFTLTKLQVGTRVYDGLSVRAWTKLGADRCLIGMDLLWSTYTQFDFRNRIIVASESPTEYWHGQWGACAATLNQTQATADWIAGQWGACGETVSQYSARVNQLLSICGKKCNGK